MESVSSRHAGDLGGTLGSFDPSQAVTVQIAIDPDLAHTPAVQHAAWMLVNLLARAEGIVAAIRVVPDPDVPVRERTIPFGTAGHLHDRLAEAGTAIGVVPVTLGIAPADRVIVVGHRHPTTDEDSTALIALGAGWWGGVAFGPVRAAAWADVDAARDEPIGPYIAASLAAADVFLRIRDPRAAEISADRYGWNAWTSQPDNIPSQLGPGVRDVVLDSVGLAGVGAVGAAWMHTVWATSSVTGGVLAVDADAEGVSISNLNRGLLFCRKHLSAPKAATAAAVAAGSVEWDPRQGYFETEQPRPALLISAVDTNNARDALQALYSAQTLSASTQDLRAEVSVAGSPGVGACLRCFNTPEPTLSDSQLRARARHGGHAIIRELSEEIGVDTDDVQRRLDTPGCDTISDRMLTQLRAKYGQDAAPARFAVGFTSAMAGVLLAAETFRLFLDPTSRPLAASARTTFQFRRPASPLNGTRAYPRDQACPKCAPTTPAMAIWRARHEKWQLSS